MSGSNMVRAGQMVLLVAALLAAASSCRLAVVSPYDEAAFQGSPVEAEDTTSDNDGTGATTATDTETADSGDSAEETGNEVADEGTTEETEVPDDDETTPTTTSVTLAWDANSESEVTGYRLYYGTESGTYTASLDVGFVTEYPIEGLQTGVTYYFAVTAYTGAGLESDYSDELAHQA